ncbi:unnamed protein product [Brassicogethes aeneus]|uniref:Centrosomal protein of 97 kDa n=1 Tax=Brassicogethes aeneus TaxID=1431903 RepID=A0A9P0FL53_BRAAE|nr:unnamed protein product [Brassicogethes aeneus]
MEESPETLDLSNKKLKKLNKPNPNECHVTSIILDDNELQRLDNIDSFYKLQKLSAVRNQLLRMYGVCRLHSLNTLNLANNGILTIEGLKDLICLKWLCLSGNSIKTIEHLHTNTNLEYLDLSENSISFVGDLSYLKNLKELYLHKNKINHLSQCDRFLPISLTTLTLSNNNISDLNEISRLVNLIHLTKISIANNPCVNMTGSNVLRAEWLYSQGRGRHYRVGDQSELTQYLASVCPLGGEALETEDDRKLRLILSKAQHHQQQLKEQGDTPAPSPVTRKKLQASKNSPRLNSSRLSNKLKSPDRMSSSCYGGNSDYDKSNIMSLSLDSTMLRQNLNKSANDTNNYIISEKYLECEPVNSPLQALSKMVPVPESLMSPDFRPGNLIGANAHCASRTAASTIPTPAGNKTAQAHQQQPRTATPVSLRSPKPNRPTPGRMRPQQLGSEARKSGGGSPSPARQRKFGNNGNVRQETPKKTILRKSPSSDEESEMCDSKLQTIHLKAEERRKEKDAELSSNCSNEDKVEQAVVFIQKMWRGYYTRNKNKEIQEMFRTLQNQRANQYIQKLASDMENTKAALESERKIQMLQTEAISALWKKISAIQPGAPEPAAMPAAVSMTNLSSFGSNAEVVKELAQTCTMLQGQIQQLQCSMQDIVKVMTAFSQSAAANQLAASKENGIATQTEIVAVHTPQGDAGKHFPFQKQTRPSSLPLPVSARKKDGSTSSSNGANASLNSELKTYAGNLVDGVIRTVSENKEATLAAAAAASENTEKSRDDDE